MRYASLAIAIAAEVVATMLLPLTNGFTRLVPCLGVLAGYGAAFYFLSVALRSIPIPIAYSIWSGLGVALVTVISWLLGRHPIEVTHVIGIALIVAGSTILYFNLHAPRIP